MGMFAYWLNYRTFSDLHCLVAIATGTAGFTLEKMSDEKIERDVQAIITELKKY
jgi:hypothetical protein